MVEQRKRPSKFWRLIRRVSFFLVLVLVLGAGIVWAKNLVLGRQIQYVFPQEGSLDLPIQIDALVANTEQVVTTPVSGKLDKLLAQGERVRKGSLVGRVIAQNSGAKVNLISPIAGLINYNIDGQEGLVTAKNLKDWDLAKFQAINGNPAAKENFTSGQGIIKITDNLTPTYLFFKLNRPGLTLKTGDSVTLMVDQQKIYGKVQRLSSQGPAGGMVVSMNSFLPQSLGKRRLQLSWVDRNVPKGMLIPKVALVDNQGVKGVFVIKDGVVQWQKVQVISQSPEQYCVNGITTDNPVVTTPGSVHDGQILNG